MYKQIKGLIAVAAIVALSLSPMQLEARGHSASRPYYGGGHHTTSHGGHYQNGHGSSHKGGKYKNDKTDDQYGQHK